MNRFQGPGIALVALVIAALTACPPNTPGDDTTPPTFGGIVSITATGGTTATIAWDAASDDLTATADIIYNIFMASLSDPPTDVDPAFVTEPGATSFDVTGLPVFQSTFFLVKAVDGAGNVDVNEVVESVATTEMEWELVDGAQAGGISDDIARAASAAVSAGGLYAMWNEYGTSFWTARVQAFDGTDWTAVDDGVNLGINYGDDVDYTDGRETVSLVSYGDKLYAAWGELNSTTYQIRVARYDPASPGAGWKFVEKATPDNYGLNKDTAENAQSPVLVVAGDDLVVIWLEDSGGWPQVRASKYNGNDSSPSWTRIDGDGATGINLNTSAVINSPAAEYLDGHLVAAWIESDVVRVRAWDGSTWATIDGGGLNYDIGEGAQEPSLRVASAKLYAAWSEDSQPFQIRVAVFGGSFTSPTWDFVDGGGADGSASADVTYDAWEAHLAELNGGLILLMAQYNGTVNVLRARAFNGDLANPGWLTVDGGSSNGLNYSAAYSSWSLSASTLGGVLYAVWVEGAGVGGGRTRAIVGR